MWSIALVVLATGQGAPAGFKAVDERAVMNHRPDWDATSYSVSLDGDRLRVETREQWWERNRNARAPRPKVVLDFGMSKVGWNPGDGVRVEDGWICGYDNGEFGGGLYWFSPDGSRHVEIDGKNVAIVGKTSKGIFAVRSLTHLMFWYADLVAVEPSPAGWKLRSITDLHRSPGPILQAGDRFIYATDEYVSTLETDGTQHELYHPWGRISPDSMVRRANGEIWIGSTLALLRLTPKTGGKYAPQWFVPLSRPRAAKPE